jgi:hypothetical protein
VRYVEGLTEQQSALVWYLHDKAPLPVRIATIAAALRTSENVVKVQVSRIRTRRPELKIERVGYSVGYVYRGPEPGKKAELTGVERRAYDLVTEDWQHFGVKAAREAGFESPGNLNKALRSLQRRGLVDVHEVNGRDLAYRRRPNAWLN